jgi:hypothetical protein
MIINYFKSILFASALVFSSTAFGDDSVDSRYIGVWKGSWLEGMSSGKATLDIVQGSGALAVTALPWFGVEPAPLKSIKSSEKSLGFQTVGADGRVMRFDLKPSSDYKKLKGKAYYDGLHMELELTREP